MNGARTTVLTLALGRRYYFDLAINLARSFLRFHQPDSLRFLIATDLTDPLPADLRGCERLLIPPGQYGAGFRPKLYLDHLVPEGSTLFLDSDILIYEPLDRIFKLLNGSSVAVVGKEVNSGEWFGNVPDYCSRLGVPAIPKFNGGLYYFEAGPVASAVFASARELAERYDELGLVRLRGHPNDELVIAGAMALHGLKALPDDGSFMADPMACPGTMTLNILRGVRRLNNPPPPNPRHQSANLFRQQSPSLVHFLGEHALMPPYRAEVLRLKLVAQGWPNTCANLLANFCILLPGQAMQFLKSILRPLVHATVGPRRVAPTPRE